MAMFGGNSFIGNGNSYASGGSLSIGGSSFGGGGSSFGGGGSPFGGGGSSFGGGNSSAGGGNATSFNGTWNFGTNNPTSSQGNGFLGGGSVGQKPASVPETASPLPLVVVGVACLLWSRFKKVRHT